MSRYGCLECATQVSLGYMEIVRTRDAATLLPIIQAHVQPGTVIWSDSWAAYNGVAQLPGIQNHSTVNHSMEFTTPTGVHTNHIESYWNRSSNKCEDATDPNCHLTWMSSCGVKGTGGRMTMSLIICIETSLSGFQCNLSHTSAFTVNLL